MTASSTSTRASQGLSRAGKAFAAPTYLFITGILILIVTGLV